MNHHYTSGEPRTAVIILNWNGERLLDEFLPKVIANTPPGLGRIIVADNGSTDGSIALLRERYPEVEVIAYPENYGFAEGYNRALADTRYPYTVLLNSDVAPAPGWLRPLVDFMDANPQAGACQPKLLSYREPMKFEYAGAAGGYLDRNGYPYCRGRIFGVCETDSGQYQQNAEIDWATGAAMMVRTDLYIQAGGLDPRFFAHMEEIDLCWRMRLAGYRLYAVPESVCYHLGGGSLPASNPRKTYLNFRNNLLMLHKNLPDDVRGRKLILRRLLDTLAWAQFVVTGQWGNARALLKAHRDFARMRKDYPTATAKVNLLDGRPDILTQFYLRGRKTFDRL